MSSNNTQSNTVTQEVPKDWLEGLKQNFSSDLTSGFIVFLLALPLSLGIAGASGFPPIMGVLSAIIGGVGATFLTGSPLSIKGPAAGLIVIVAGAVSEFGGGTIGWQLTLGVMVVAGLIQILFGVLKLGKFVDIFPLSAIHGMLAAIGLIIIAKQVPILMNVDPAMMKGKGPISLFMHIPEFVMHLDPMVSIIGAVSLVLMMGWPLIKQKHLKKIPAPLLVLLFAIPAGVFMGLKDGSPDYTLIKVGNIAEQVGWNVDFSGISMVGVFIKYVIMVALVGSLESLLTVKAIDMMDPYKRKSDPNKDMIAVGVANTFAAVLGGIPMISEVARSSANVQNGGKTRWANFFHGVFLLIFALAAYPLLEMIPNAALAAMLISVGIKLAHPKEFIQMYKIGPEQLAIFLTTIFFTLFEDLLIGIASGMALKMVLHVLRGASWKGLFKATITIEEDGNEVNVHLQQAAVFTNYMSIKSRLASIPPGKHVKLDFTDLTLIDHSVMENLHHFKDDYTNAGGEVTLVGLDDLKALSEHPLAARKAVLQKTIEKKETINATGRFDEEKVLHDLKHYLPGQAALKDFVHHNSLHAFQEMEFFDAIFSASEIFGIQTTFNINEYRKLYKQGRIKADILDRVILETKGQDQLGKYIHTMLEKPFKHSYSPRIGGLHKKWKYKYHLDLNDRVQPILFRIIGAYLDQGIAIDHFPNTDNGLLAGVKQLELHSFSSFFSSKRVKNLLLSDNLSLPQLLEIVVGKEAYYEQYILDQQFSHKGWSGIISAIELTPETLLFSKCIDLKEFIMLELLLEIDALDTALGKNWQGIALHADEAPQNYFAPVEHGELQEVLKLWQLAFEWDYYDEVLSALQSIAGKKVKKPLPEKKSFQALFCIDDREDSIRRHFEYADPNCETIGAPGFFGAAIYFQALGSNFYEKNCPVPITPKHLIKETETKSKHKTERLHSHLSHTAITGFIHSLALGFVAAGRFAIDLYKPQMRPDIADAYSHMDIRGKLQIETDSEPKFENGLQIGYTVEEMADVVYNLLRNHGMTSELSDIVYIISHGSSSANNPHHGAHDCGACSGRPGAVNARVFAHMANHKGVRAILADRGMIIRERTHFLGAMHDTASDEIRYYDRSSLTQVNFERHEENLKAIEKALDLNAMERARRFASIDITKDISQVRQKIKERSVSYFEPRPELGHGTNALCFVGSRPMVSDMFLDRRAFHQTYDYKTDPDGNILKAVLGPLPIVCGGINLEYYFSRMDIEKMGAGTKLPHHVMGLIGVTNSADGDLRPGLPLQMVENHDPVRLLMIIEQKPSLVLEILKSVPTNYDWFDKGWIHLVVLSPEDSKLYRFENGAFVPYTPLSAVNHSKDILRLIGSGKEMETNHILDATKENIPVHIYN
jgi:uncharacterized protein YbcC (UPF0753/DUF2309 family)/MFS superfamily sulfate permease-like transporter